ncbi:hypothetical protein SAMN05444274_104156 [Mariniphaga anaerophila]|uniref:Peptidase MA superfamily protein n=1 Tax=Mariniphaga anaerophila TaxID=1484053 RepID=A0A1M5A2C9_9BACT|nr:hypothetical protein [Mariniphaga anaerophila]SHF24443.1 hypothetical protein SAMN05444274_104156 [Mariniphaga anaerophila]
MKIWISTLIILIYIPFSSNGQEEKWLLNKDSIFTSISSEHFNLYSLDGHLTKKIKLDILQKRESAYREISDFFEIEKKLVINIFLFKNEHTKYTLTGHKGIGWGFDNNIVEVFNDSFRMDPYHELVHVVGYTLNKPPALIDEGTAVYLSQLYGNKAFSKMIGYPTKSINEILLLLSKREGFINISDLLSYNEVGNILAYCTSASFVEFLIQEFGKQKFLELFKSLSNANSAKNKIIFEKIYGVKFSQIEDEWTNHKNVRK